MVKLGFFAKKKQEQISSSLAKEIKEPKGPDKKGYHTVRCHDGAKIKFRLLLGGPKGNNQFDPTRRTAICLHGIGDSSETWASAFFRTEALDLESQAVHMGQSEKVSVVESEQNTKRRGTMLKNLAKYVNVVMLDQRGFGISGRPTTDSFFTDTSVTLFATYKIEKGEAFNTAIQKYVTDCSHDGHIMGCSVSVSGSTALIRTSYMKMFHAPFSFNFTDDASPEKGAFSDCASLVETIVVASQEDWENADQMWPATFLESRFVKRFTRNNETFLRDRMHNPQVSKDSDVTLIYRLKLMKKQTEAFSDACKDVMKAAQEDPLCLSLSFLTGPRGMQVISVCSGAAAALRHMQLWDKSLNSKEKDALGKFVKKEGLQVHAKGPELRELKAAGEVAGSSQFFQVFPPSFETSMATTCGAVMDDFVKDIESVISHLGIQKASILGHSLGAAIAIGHSLAYPHHVDRLCTIGGAPRVGQAAYNNWMMISGNTMSWEMRVTKQTVAVANFKDEDLAHCWVPTLLVNAEDDTLTPLVGSQLLKQVMPNSLLYAPSWGGHNLMTFNDEAAMQIVTFLAEDTSALLWTEDKLLPEMYGSPWGLTGDSALMKYYMYGSVLAEVESSERRTRLIRAWAKNESYKDDLELAVPYQGHTHPEVLSVRRNEIGRRREGRMARMHEEHKTQLAFLYKVGLESGFSGYNGTPREFLLEMMTEMMGKMSAPGLQAVENAGPWWRDTGKAEKNWNSNKYTVDLFGIRRGGCKKTGCVWYRWNVANILADIRNGMVPLEVRQNEENFRCWWCGALPGDHENVGKAGEDEEPGYFPGLGPDGQPWQKPEEGLYFEDEPEWPEEESYGGGAPFQRVDLSKVHMLPDEQDENSNRIWNMMRPQALIGKSGALVPVVY
mmetsp:Transcript_119736/g.211682  ORF Transcript_119736/g.211682 Transcript_119736/m.211682 type:complete len:895 (-) Transcript_119736:168-2852(-)